MTAGRCSSKIPFETCVLRALRVCFRPRNIRHCACGCVPEAAREDPLRAGAPATSWPARVAARSQSRFTAQTRDRVRVPAEARGAITGSSSSNAANTSVCARAQANGRLVEASGGEAILCVRRVRLFGSFATRITLPGSCFDHPLKRLDHPHTGGPAHRARGHSAGHRAPIACASAALFRNDANLNNAHPSRAPAAPAAPPHAAAPPLSRIPA